MWIVQVKGDPDSRAWEISVVRESNTLGRDSWGWFNEDKLLISHNGGPCDWPLAPGVGDRMVAIAMGYANDLNSKESYAPDRDGDVRAESRVAEKQSGARPSSSQAESGPGDRAKT